MKAQLEEFNFPVFGQFYRMVKLDTGAWRLCPKGEAKDAPSQWSRFHEEPSQAVNKEKEGTLIQKREHRAGTLKPEEVA